jgi:hypothetical protein
VVKIPVIISKISKLLLLFILVLNFSIIGFQVGSNLVNENLKDISGIEQNKQVSDHYQLDNDNSNLESNPNLSNPSESSDFQDIVSEISNSEKSSNDQSVTPDLFPRFDYVDTSSGVIEHYVDQISDIDSLSDRGNHDVFDDLQATDNIVDRLSTPSSSSEILINGESFEGSFPGWTMTGEWNDEQNTAFDGSWSADFDGNFGQPSGYLTTPSMDTSDATSITIEFYYLDELLDDNDFELELFDGTSWDIDYVGLDTQPNEGNWNFYSEVLIDSQYFVPNFQIRWYAETVGNGEHAYVDSVTVSKERELNLDLEVQFIDIGYFMDSEELAIKTGSFSDTTLKVQFWTGSEWTTITDTLSTNSWNNFSISISNPIYTIRFIESVSDSTQHWWDIDSVLLVLGGSGNNEYPAQSDLSDVDFSEDKGILSDFNNIKNVDSNYANLTAFSYEENNTHSTDLTGGYLTSTTANPSSTSGTISYWVKYNLISGRTFGANGNMEVRFSGSSISLDWGTTGVLASSSTFSAGTWYFVAITWNENQNNLFIYTTQAGSEPSLDASLSGTWIESVSSLGVTEVRWGAGIDQIDQIDGHLDDLRYYGTDRSLSEIISDYNKTLSGNEVDLVNYYKLDSNYTDSAGSDNLSNSGSVSFVSDVPPWEISALNYELDQEVQWNGLAHFLENETLAIKTGSFNTDENILVDYWNGSWNNILSSLNENSWNNISIKDYLTTPTFTIRIRDENTSTSLNSWLIDIVLISVRTTSAPTATNSTISPNDPDSLSDLTISYDYFDPTSDPEITSNRDVHWYKNGFHNTSYDNISVLPYTATLKGETWFFMLRVHDGKSYSEWTNSTSVFIRNSKPSAINLKYNTTFVLDSDDFEIQYTYADPDGDLENKSQVIVHWEVNGSKILGSLYGNQTVIYSSNTTAGSFYNYSIIVFDGTDYSDETAAPLIMGISGISNDPPNALNPVITPLNANTSSNLNANYTYSDNEGHPETVSQFRWFKSLDNVSFNLVPSLNDMAVIPSSETKKGEYWFFEVTPKDLFNFGIAVNSTKRRISNTNPTVENIQISENVFNTTDITVSWDFTDADAEDLLLYTSNILVFTNITWYKNDVVQVLYSNKTQFNSSGQQKYDTIYYTIQVYDGENYSQMHTSISVTVQNSIPIVSNIGISPNYTLLYTNNSLTLSYDYFDSDLDPEITSSVITYWFRDFVLQSHLTNETEISANELNKGDRWSVEFQVYDGTNFSSLQSFGFIIIQNSPGMLTDVFLSNNLGTIDVSQDLILTRTFIDQDGDFAFLQNITWYLFDEKLLDWIYQPIWDNQSRIPSNFLNKEQNWYALINVYDSEDWTILYQSNAITIINSNPEILSLEFAGSDYQHFFTENEDIKVVYSFLDLDIQDSDESKIMWYVNGVYQPEYDNLTTIYSNQTHSGEEWSVQILPSDGESVGSLQSLEGKIIEDVPDFNNFDFYPINDTEGHYLFWFNVTANPANPIGTDKATIVLDIIINNSESYFVIADWNGTHYVFDWYYTKYLLLGTEIIVIAEASTRVNYADITYLISEYISFNFTLLDTAPPRVKQVDIELNSKQNPSEITFIVEVEEFGTEIENATLFYLYQTPTDSSRNRLKYTSFSGFKANLDGFTKVDLRKINTTHYFVTLDFNSGSPVDVFYQVQLSDKSGNVNLNAWPDGTDPDKIFQYNPPLLNFTPEELGIFVIVIFVVVLVFSFLLNRKFRSKELVGLDKESVIKNIHKIKIQDVEESLDLYSLGVVISFFDQRLGPLPVLYQPPFLRDNYDKLLELADISFSTGRFVKNFIDEEQSSFTFSFDPDTQIKIFSYSFSINRPEARGGSENLILKIMLSTEVFPLISQFGNQIKNIVFRIHRTLDADVEGNDKEKVGEMLNEIRELIASIALSHLDLYETIEIETTESVGNNNG